MRHSCLKNPIKVYSRFLVLIFIVLKYLGCSNSLIGNRRAIVLYWRVDFSIKRNISLYCLLTTFTQILTVFGRSIPLKKAFNSEFEDLIRLLINAESF